MTEAYNKERHWSILSCGLLSNTDDRALFDAPSPRFRLLIEKGFAVVGGDRQQYGEQMAKLAEGDILLMYQNGVGIVAIGKVKESWDGVSHADYLYYTAIEMELTSGAHEYRIEVAWFLDLSSSPIGLEEIKNRLGYIPQGAIERIVKHKAEVARIIEELWTTKSTIPEEVAEPSLYVEGAIRMASHNAYERNPEARLKCTEHHGTNFCICGFSFGAIYGPEAEGYIHVHHIRPLSEIGGEYVVDPISDLQPVCPNCHAVLHLGGRCRSSEEVRQMLRQQGTHSGELSALRANLDAGGGIAVLMP
jgi:hypothetical protein